MPQIRPGRTRSKRNNRRAPLLLSSMRPEDFNVRPTEPMSIACPDCGFWRRIMGETDLKIREHSCTDRGHGLTDDGCPGSNQPVIVDIDVKRWQARQDRLLRDAMPCESRHAEREFSKPQPTPGAPVHRIVVPFSVDSARQRYLAHRSRCAACIGRELCVDGERLAVVYVRFLRQEPRRAQVRAAFVRERARFDRRYAAQLPKVRAAEWADQANMFVKRSGWAKRSGTAVEELNNQCKSVPPNAVSEFRGPELPLKPLRVTV